MDEGRTDQQASSAYAELADRLRSLAKKQPTTTLLRAPMCRASPSLRQMVRGYPGSADLLADFTRASQNAFSPFNYAPELRLE
jgi:hypothetical protein